MIQAVYRIYTEDKNYTKTVETVQSYFGSFTIYREVTGYWKGTEEQSLVFEIIADDTQSLGISVRAACEAVRNVNVQQAVLYTKHLVTSELV